MFSILYTILAFAIKLLDDVDWVCTLHASVLTFSLNAQIVVTMIIAYTVHQTIISKRANIESYWCKFVTISIFIPLIITIIPIFYKAYGVGLHGLCWIKIIE